LVRDWLSSELGAEAILTDIAAPTRVVQQLTPFRERLWDVEGLGEVERR
jgi:hypothetical protein